MMRKLAILCLVVLFSFSDAKAQKDTFEIRTIVKSFGDSVALRWGPTSKRAWQYGNEVGYKIEKLIFKENAFQNSSTIDNIKLKPQGYWDRLSLIDSYAEAAKTILFTNIPSNSETRIDAILTRELQEDNLYGFALLMADLSFPVAKGMALGFTDTNVAKDFSVAYKVSFQKEPQGVYVKSDFIKKDLIEIISLPSPDSLESNFGNFLVELKWPVGQLNSTYSAYDVYRSSNGLDFQKVNKAPFVPMTANYVYRDNWFAFYKDTLPQNNVEYTYKVVGLSPFGEKGPESNPTKGIGLPPPIPVAPVIVDVKETESKEFLIEWYFDENFVDKIKGFRIVRSLENKEQYLEISNALLDHQQRQFTDQNPGEVNFYKIEVQDINGHWISSIPVVGQLTDQEPPLAPKALEGQCDTNGVVLLSWQPNRELDLSGYLVYSGNVENGEYSILTRMSEWKDTLFTDTISLNNLSDKIYYKVRAVDFRGNRSDFSKALKINRPDLIPPVPSVFKKRTLMQDSIYLSWVNSSSKDVVEINLERKIKDSSEWYTVFSDNAIGKFHELKDGDVSYQNEYLYRLVAMDDAGLQSISDTLFLQPIDGRKREEVKKLEVQYFEKRKDQKAYIGLNWSFKSPTTSVKRITIFRSVNNVQATTLVNLKPSDLLEGDFDFMDYKVFKGDSYSYKIVVKYEDGGVDSTDFSDVLSLEK